MMSDHDFKRDKRKKGMKVQVEGRSFCPGIPGTLSRYKKG